MKNRQFTWKQIMDALGALRLPTNKIMLVRAKLIELNKTK
jgi:hypothetical protein